MTPVVTAVNASSTAIVNAVTTTAQSIKDAVTGVKTATDAVKTSVDAVKAAADKTTDAVKAASDALSNKIDDLTKATKDNGTQAKNDAKAQLDETKKKTQQDKDFQDWEKLTHECQTKPKELSAQDFVNNAPATGGNPSQINKKLCAFADSFEDYQAWIKGEGTDKDGKPYGIPDAAPNGKVGVTQTGLSDYGLSGSELDTNYLNFGNSCPAPNSYNVSMLGKSFSITYSYQALCDLAPIFRIILEIAAYLAALRIVFNAIRG